ncbi:hypothetical protein EJ06DRAFT_269270 [Trichodelitschia bisporula]|uniref:Uncharacterized protein n=1 Tax=Trichodelitschia bisporula TaxID=703511 RepID=A0A6G1HHS3_9PEZI|nr:hypothetical protein EJ06DRAFT_269270 [Trichodelitschia bisporula]
MPEWRSWFWVGVWQSSEGQTEHTDCSDGGDMLNLWRQPGVAGAEPGDRGRLLARYIVSSLSTASRSSNSVKFALHFNRMREPAGVF